LSAGQHAARLRQTACQPVSKGLEIGEYAAQRAIPQSAAGHEPQRQQAEMLTS
jgi:hypothetical protein